ncbi:hypothetical protein L7F22_003521 [Adiantum nelumboides]|nr:hypothetical protein [Adiantum nelumboides]
MEEFEKLVEVYKWRGNALKQNEAIALPPQIVPDRYGEEASAGSGCTGSYSSPSPSFLQKMGLDVDLETMKTDAVSGDMPDMALSFAPGWHKPRQRHLLKKKPRSLQGRSTRQLVFSVEGSAEKVKSKKIMKSRSKREKVELKQAKSEQVQTSNLLDFYDNSDCENGPTPSQEYHSLGISKSPDQHSPAKFATCSKEKRGMERMRTRGTRGKSPYFILSQHNTKMKGANKDKQRLTKKAEVSSTRLKPCTQRRKKEYSITKAKVEITEIKHLPGHASEPVDLKDSGEQSACSSKEFVSLSDSASLHNKATSRTKKSAYFEATVKALGQRNIANKAWVPPVSVHALIQEELYKDPWKVLVACMLLNKTSGKQMRQIIWDLFDLCPTPEAAVMVETSKIENVIWRLGLQKKRARMIQKFSNDYLGKDWTNVGQLHGIGKYATDAYAIFCEGRWQEVKPEDHKLVDYWKFLCATDGLGYAFKDDREEPRIAAVELTIAEVRVG